MNYKDLLGRAEQYVVSLFEVHLDSKMVYHNREHTLSVVEAVTKIADHYKLDKEDRFVVLSAAWFHDSGYLYTLENHESRGAELAEEFMSGEDVSNDIIQQVKGCIMATTLPQKPHNLLEKILCDADLFHFGTEAFSKRSRMMLEEYNNLHDKQLSKNKWRELTIAMLEEHEYYTDYCRTLLDHQKEKNLEKLKSKVHYDHTQDIHAIEGNESPQNGNPNKNEDKASKKERPERGIETMFRISSNNQSRLSDMADNKAHILITVNSIILSAVISLVLRRLDTNTFLILPSFILLTISLVTIIFSILATRPTIPQGTFTPDDVTGKRVNLMFFGNFYKMNLSDYGDAMRKVMGDNDFLYDNLIRDVYFQGIVLGKKYKLLRIAYNVFMFGLSVSIIAFIVSFLMDRPTPMPPPIR